MRPARAAATVVRMNIEEDQAVENAHHALALLDDLVSFAYPAALGAVARLGVADHLAGGPRTAAELAEATATHAPSLHRVLRLLATRGILREDADGRFALTPRGQLLRKDVPLSVSAVFGAFTGPFTWRPTGEIMTSLRAGTPAFDAVFGAPYFQRLEENPSAAADFHRAMASITDVYELLLAADLDLPEHGTVVDVGGGLGGLLLAILRSRPGLRAVLFDRPQAVEGHRLGDLGAPDRWRVASGDFFAEVPDGGDVYILKAVLHDWSDEQCGAILRTCRQAMASGSRLLVIESVMESGGDMAYAATLDVVMMGLVQGRERTEAEFVALLGDAGLKVNRVVPTRAPVSIIEAIPA